MAYNEQLAMGNDYVKPAAWRIFLDNASILFQAAWNAVQRVVREVKILSKRYLNIIHQAW